MGFYLWRMCDCIYINVDSLFLQYFEEVEYDVDGVGDEQVGVELQEEGEVEEEEDVGEVEYEEGGEEEDEI